MLAILAVLVALLIPALPAAAGSGYSPVTVWYGASSVTIDQTTWDTLKASYGQTITGTYNTNTYEYSGVPVYRLLEQITGVSALSDYSALVEDGSATPYQVLVGPHACDNIPVKSNDTLIIADSGTLNGSPDTTRLPRLVCPSFTGGGKYYNQSIVKITLVYTISVSAPTNGTISPSGYTWNTSSTNPWSSATSSGAVYVTNGGSQTFTMAGNTGYHISALTIDGGAVTPATSYTFSNVTANHTLAATFSDSSVSVSITPSFQSVANGTTFNVSLAIDTSTASRGWQANVDFDATKLSANSVTEGTFLSAYATANGGGTVSGGAATIDNVGGHVVIPGYAITGAGTGGPTGTGTLCTISFTAKPAVNSAASITPSAVVVADVNGTAIPGVTLAGGTVAIGTLPLPDLVVSAASTTAEANPAMYTVTYTITNNGADAGASTTSISIDGGTPITVACPALATGASDTQTTAAQTLSGTADSILITADSAFAVGESNESNNTRTTSYSYAPAQPGDVPVSGTTQTVLNFVLPDAVSWDPLNIGDNSADRTMKVTSNTDWQVTVLGTNNGYMTKYNGTIYDPAVKLHDALLLMSENTVTLTDSSQVLADGTPAGQPLDNSGDARSVAFHQQVYYVDTALPSGSYYYVVVTFTASQTI